MYSVTLSTELCFIYDYDRMPIQLHKQIQLSFLMNTYLAVSDKYSHSRIAMKDMLKKNKTVGIIVFTV